MGAARQGASVVVNDVDANTAEATAAPTAAAIEPNSTVRREAPAPGRSDGAPLDDPAAAAEHTRYDLRTATQARADDMAALSRQLTRVLDALDYLTRRVGVLEAENAALHIRVGSHDETLQAITLRGDDGR